MSIKFKKLNKTIIKCNKCPRLITFIKKISSEKRKQNIDEKYWGKPVTGFGDNKAKLMILGLAPAAHGGTRTGRAFTGDKSGDFLFKSLFKIKISNQSYSRKINDRLKLSSTYITNILKCVPPGDKPLNNELINCSDYFISELDNLKNLKVIVTLGKVALTVDFISLKWSSPSLTGSPATGFELFKSDIYVPVSNPICFSYIANAIVPLVPTIGISAKAM